MILEIRDIKKRYRGGVVANDGISLSVGAGEVFGLLGPNGAGKTTLVNQVLGLVEPTSGAIDVDGVDVVRNPAYARRVCSYQPQSNAPVAGLTPREAIELIGRIRGGVRSLVRARATELLGAVDIGEWEKKTTPLSGGVARLVSFCLAAVVPGQVVILDEPTNDVDPLRRKLMWTQVRALADEGAAVLLVTHNVLEAERCVDRLAIVDHGRVLASGTPARLKTALGAALRLELVLEQPDTPFDAPRFASAPVIAGRRVYFDIGLEHAGNAVAWAKDLQDRQTVAEFFLGPASLEDVYVRNVGPGHNGSEDDHGAPVAR
jgi:ABC-2 type transport system ATP-binding protein